MLSIIFQDISGIQLSDIQNERCPRISASDLVKLLGTPNSVAVIDLRSNLDYKRAHIEGSINIPFTSVSLSDVRLDALRVENLQQRLENRIVVVVSTFHDNAVLVRNIYIYSFEFNKPRPHLQMISNFTSLQFSKFILDCGTAHVCTLHKGFNILHSVIPNILTSTS